MASGTDNRHPWKFTSLGGFSQAKMETAADFANLEHLDQKLWAALACPVKGLAFDEKTLAMLDHDDDGRIRAPEVIGAASWCKATLKSLDALAKGGQPLQLSQINTDSEEGASLLSSAQQILKDLGKEGAATLSVDEAAQASDALAKSAFNGDGVVPAASASEESLQTLINEIVDCLGGVPDRSGEVGVDQAKVDTFFADAQALIDWADAGGDDVRPLGDATEAAADAVAAVKTKVDDFFARCRLAAFDDRAIAALNRKEEEYLAIAAEDLSVTAEEVSSFPLARIEAGRSLPLSVGVNPAWAAALAALKSTCVATILSEDKDELTEADWADIQAKLTPFEAWRGSKPATAVDKLSVDRLREILATNANVALARLIALDADQAPNVAAVGQVERLVRYHRDMYRLAQNFVNFTDFYSDTTRATFEAGTLYLDGRACELVVRVDDAGKHAALAGRSKLFLAYCDCTRPSGEKLAIAAAFTDGDSDYLMVGRNGVFYDRDGKDWDATITKIVDNPISLRQAFWAPYKQLVRFFEELAENRAKAKEAAAEKQRLDAANQAAGKPGEAPKPPSIDIGVVAAIAVGVGALGSMAVAMIGYLTGLFTMPFWIICLVLLAVFIAISTPSVLMAYLKLRQRSLGPVLDSNGWAVNGRAKVSVRFGVSMTEVAHLPKGARVTAKDKYADPVNPWPRLILVVVVIAFLYSLINWFGVFHALTGGMIGDPASTVEVMPAAEPTEDAAPAATPAADPKAAPAAAPPAE
jgi:hypothetical protein